MSYQTVFLAAAILVVAVLGAGTPEPSAAAGGQTKSPAPPTPPPAPKPIEFRYDNLKAWPPLCHKGSIQSPINFGTTPESKENSSSVSSSTSAGITRNHLLPPIQLSQECRLIDNKTALSVTNNGHSIVATLTPLSDSTELAQHGCRVKDPVSGDEFALAQMHLHKGGEHAFRGRRADMELHMVFQQADGRTLVLGVPLSTVSTQNSKNPGTRLLNLMLTKVPTTVGKPLVHQGIEVNTKADNSLSLDKLLPGYDGSYFTYLGSLTTPPCTERVRWVVFASPMYINKESVDAFAAALDKTSPGFKKIGNARPLQPRNNRPIDMYADPNADHAHAYLSIHLQKGTISAGKKKENDDNKAANATSGNSTAAGSAAGSSQGIGTITYVMAIMLLAIVTWKIAEAVQAQMAHARNVMGVHNVDVALDAEEEQELKNSITGLKSSSDPNYGATDSTTRRE